MTTCAPRPEQRSRVPAQRRRPPRRQRRRAHSERGSISALELMALTPVCALAVAFIAWAGNTGQAQLAVTLAAQEAATAAAVCCSSPWPHDAAYDQNTARQLTAEAVIAARPSLERLCIGGPQPAGSHGQWSTHTATPDNAAAVVTVHIACTTDGAATPVRGLFGTRTVHGHGTHITTAPTTKGTP